ncbi:preprotein translocase subunit SecE [Sorangium sp. So ce375]|jgi:preprotein translocase subunit SecE|uniref:preprotein translocase subunit SecE n=1 Tax=Sorangium sp. So ce375 TaxID=3133306 RepID=UPI003F5AFDEB
MAKGQKDKQPPKVAEDEEPEESEPGLPADASSLVTRSEGTGAADAKDAEASSADESDDADEAEDEGAAAQLGTERYVLAGFFASGMLLAYLLGKFVHGVWATLANKDWFSRTLPALSAVGDDDKTTYGMIIGGVVALIVVLRSFRNAELRNWSDEVASELAKVKWPTKKEVTNATFVVIATTTVATLYLALLDRFWAFVTNIVYGDGS